MTRLWHPTLFVAIALMGIIVMMVVPVPPIVLDIGLALSFGAAVTIFTISLFIERPLDFSAFPSMLLGALMLRLGLNVSSTKLIIGEGHTGTGAAGDVIEGFALFVMGGSILLGLVVFAVLMIVNFIVITKGAGRMAEVGARFALDAMPGKQLAIDSDLSAGAISHEEARERRATEQAETTFFGSLDGASKFVKGDAVAGLLITILNLVMGLAAGTIAHGMAFGEAFSTYAILTVGDGLVTQIPAVIISIAAGLLLSKGGVSGSIDDAAGKQLAAHPVALGTVAVLMVAFGLVPGLPVVPFAAVGGILGVVAWRLWTAPPPEDAPPAEVVPSAPSMGDVIDLDDIHVEFSPELVPMILDPATGLDARIETIRSHIAQTQGLVIPEIRLTDDPLLPAGRYTIRIHGVEVARDILRPGRLLALLPAGERMEGERVNEPVYGAEATWIDPAEAPAAETLGATTVAPAEVLATHLMETLSANLGRLMTLRTLRRLLDVFVEPSDPARATANKRLLDDLVPEKVPMDTLQAVLRLLLDERVSIRNLPLVLEAIAEMRPATGVPEAICEHVRRRLGFQLVAGLRRDDGTIPLIQLDPGWEGAFAEHETASAEVALPPDLFARLGDNIARQVEGPAAETGAAIVTSGRRRRFVRTVLAARGIGAAVLSYDEIGIEARPALVGTVPA